MSRFSLASTHASGSQRFSSKPSMGTPASPPRFSAVSKGTPPNSPRAALGDDLATPSLVGTPNVGGDIGGISTPSLFGGGSTGASFPFGAGLATPFGSLGANLPPGLSLPASSGALGQGITALTGSAAAGKFGNAALGGLPGLAGFGVSQGAKALGVPGFLSSLLGGLAGAAIPFGGPPIPGLGLANSLLGMGITTAQNKGSVSALNALAEGGRPNTDALGRFATSPAFMSLSQGLANAELSGVPAVYALALEAAYGNPLAQGLLDAFNPVLSNLSSAAPPTGLGFNTNPFSSMFGYGIAPAMNFGLGVESGISGAATGIAPPGSTNFGIGVGEGGVGGAPGGGGGVSGPGAAGPGGEGGDAP